MVADRPPLDGGGNLRENHAYMLTILFCPILITARPTCNQMHYVPCGVISHLSPFSTVTYEHEHIAIATG